jgi:hypothetical protein
MSLDNCSCILNEANLLCSPRAASVRGRTSSLPSYWASSAVFDVLLLFFAALFLLLVVAFHLFDAVVDCN